MCARIMLYGFKCGVCICVCARVSVCVRANTYNIIYLLLPFLRIQNTESATTHKTKCVINSSFSLNF